MFVLGAFDDRGKRLSVDLLSNIGLSLMLLYTKWSASSGKSVELAA